MSQSAGLVAAAATAVVTGSFSAAPGYLLWAVGAGVSGASAVVLFYRALAIGTMGIVAPIAALGVIVPVMIGLIGGALPSTLSLIGIVIGICGVVAAAGPRRSGAPNPEQTRSILLAVGAALGFGLLQYAISGGSKYSTVMTMVAMRATSVPLLAVVTLITLRAQSARKEPRDRSPILTYRWIALVVVIGIFDVGANLLFAIASVSGALAIVAVLGSLYPAATILLARFIDHERMSRIQNVGVLAAVVGVVMIAAGS